MRNVLFLFGAGASFGAGLRHGPPLGGKVEGRSPGLFRELATFSPDTWGNLPASLHPIFETDFERGMAMVRADPELKWMLTPLLERMAVYFAQFRADPQSSDCYSRLLQMLDEQGVRPIFSTLNYDCILEDALESRHRPPEYFARTPSRASGRIVYKLHGSCNFFSSPGALSVPRGTPLQVEESHSDPIVVPLNMVAEFCSGPVHAFPIMAQYTYGKPYAVRAALLDQAYGFWVEQVRGSSQIFVVGVKPNWRDTHIWDPICKAEGTLHYIGGSADFETLTARRSAQSLGDSFVGALANIATHLV